MHTLVDSDFSFFCNLEQEEKSSFSEQPVLSTLYYLPKIEGSLLPLSFLPSGATLLLASPWNYSSYKLLFQLPLQLGIYLPYEKDVFNCTLLGIDVMATIQLNLLRKIKVFTTQYLIIGRGDYIQDFYHYFELVYPTNNIKWLSGATRGKKNYQELVRNQ